MQRASGRSETSPGWSCRRVCRKWGYVHISTRALISDIRQDGACNVSHVGSGTTSGFHKLFLVGDRSYATTHCPGVPCPDEWPDPHRLRHRVRGTGDAYCPVRPPRERPHHCSSQPLARDSAAASRHLEESLTKKRLELAQQSDSAWGEAMGGGPAILFSGGLQVLSELTKNFLALQRGLRP
jgi:hypothetical protein